MAKMGNFSFGDMRKLQKQLETLQNNTPQILESVARELAQRLYAKVVKRTPVVSGNLRHGWKIESITQNGGNYVIEIINPVEYASYVEYGHRTKNHKGWVNGKFMLSISEQELQKITPQVLEKQILKQLKAGLQ